MTVVTGRAETAAATATPYVWDQAGAPGKSTIILLGLLSIFVWSVMCSKRAADPQGTQAQPALVDEFHQHDGVLVIHDRNIHVEGCPLLNLYDNGCKDLLGRLKNSGNEGELAQKYATFKTMNTSSEPSRAMCWSTKPKRADPAGHRRE